MLDDCNLWCIVSLPGGVFTAAGAGVKTDLLFFTKGQPTEKIWYYDLSHLKIRKKIPLTSAHFEEFFKLLPNRSHSKYSWTIDITQRRVTAAQEAEPFKNKARATKQQAEQWKEKLTRLKKAKPLDKQAIENASKTVSAKSEVKE